MPVTTSSLGGQSGRTREIAHPLAEAYMKLEGAKLATYHAARLYDQSVEDSSITSALVRLTYNSAK